MPLGFYLLGWTEERYEASLSLHFVAPGWRWLKTRSSKSTKSWANDFFPTTFSAIVALVLVGLVIAAIFCMLMAVAWLKTNGGLLVLADLTKLACGVAIAMAIYPHMDAICNVSGGLISWILGLRDLFVCGVVLGVVGWLVSYMEASDPVSAGGTFCVIVIFLTMGLYWLMSQVNAKQTIEWAIFIPLIPLAACGQLLLGVLAALALFAIGLANDACRPFVE